MLTEIALTFNYTLETVKKMQTAYRVTNKTDTFQSSYHFYQMGQVLKG